MEPVPAQNKARLKSFTDKILIIAVLIAVFGSGYRLGQRKSQSSPRTSEYNYTVKNLDEGNSRDIDFSLFWEAWNAVEQKYVDKKKVDPQTLYYGAIKGMVASVGDSYTFFSVSYTHLDVYKRQTYFCSTAFHASQKREKSISREFPSSRFFTV